MDVIVMPQLGETVVEGTITAWAKAVGDEVAVDDTLFEVSTEKVDTEVPSAVAGVLREIRVAEGETVRIGAVVAVVTATADEPYDAPGPTGSEERAPVDPGADPPAGAAPAPTEQRPRPRAGAEGQAGFLSPVVQDLLARHGLRAEDVAGSGRDGRITRADVLAAAAQTERTRRVGPPSGGPVAVSAAPPIAPPVADVVAGPDAEVVELSRARMATAEHMVRSLQTAAHALVVVQVDYARLDPVRREAGVSYLPFVARAVIDALRDHPHLNATFAGDRLVVHRRVHLGVAVDVDREALLVPVVHGADGLRVRALGAAVADLADRARRRRLAGGELEGATITITNVGSYGTVITAPIINQPQVAIVSTDGVRMEPVAVRTDDQRPGTEAQWGIAVHPVGNLSLSFDHRAVDGAYAAAFLARVRELLEARDWSAEVAS